MAPAHGAFGAYGGGLTLGSARDAVVALEAPEWAGADGGYTADPRVARLVARWPQAVGDALDRIATVAGLTFPAEAAPRVILTALGDETQAWRLDLEVSDGRRRPVVRVNVEPIAAGVRAPDPTIAAALAASVFEDLSLRQGPPPAWLVEVAKTVAAADLESRLVAVARQVRADGASAVAVDPAAPELARATALAAILVLLEDESPDAVRSFLAFAAEGDDPDAMLALVLRDPMGRWAGRGRDLLQARLATVDVRAWDVLRDARRILQEAGRGAMEASVPESLPGEVAVELQVLRAAGLLDEGAYPEARAIFAGIDASAMARLDDPAGAWLLRLQAERGPGGTPETLRALERRVRLDFPRAWQRWDDVQERPTASEIGGTDQRMFHLLALLDAHKTGAARRALEEMPDAARAPELEPVARAIAEAERSPSAAAIAANQARVRRWLRDPTAENAADVRAGGAPAAEALVPMLPARSGNPSRRDALILLAEATRIGNAVRLLVPRWQRHPSLLADDLDALLGVALYGELRVWVDGHAAGAVARAGGERLWERLRFGLEPDWVHENGAIVRDLRDSIYPRRRDAFLAVVGTGKTTPGLVAHALRDPAPLLRREAVATAGEEGYSSLVRVALTDEAWVVRQAACGAAGIALGREASRVLLPFLTGDPASQVRLAAARALLHLAKTDPSLLDPLVRSLALDDPGVRDELTRGLPSLDQGAVVSAIIRALEAEAATMMPRVPYLSRLFVLLQRATRRDPGYYPTMKPQEVRDLIANLRQALPEYLRRTAAARDGR